MKIILRDESEDDEAQVQPSEPVAKESEDAETGGSRPLKRLRKLSADDATPTVSPPLKRAPKARANRAIVEEEASSSEDGEEAAAKEGGQESLIPTEPIIIEQLPYAESAFNENQQSPFHDFSPPHTATPSTSISSEIDIHNLEVPAVLYLEAPPKVAVSQQTLPTTPILDASFNEDLPSTPVLDDNFDDQNLG